MKNKKISETELAVSKTIILFIMLAVLSVLTLLYVVPGTRPWLNINNYTNIIEYIVMGVTFIAALGACIVSAVRSKRGYTSDGEILTPVMVNIVLITAFVQAVIIPLSGSRSRISRYALITYAFIFVAYAVYFFVNKMFAYHAVVCGIYCIVLKYIGDFYPSIANFEDRAPLSYSSVRLLFALMVMLTIIVTYFVSKKHNGLRLWQTTSFALIGAAAMTVRFFTSEYVIISAITAEIVAFIIFVVIEKIHNSNRR